MSALRAFALILPTACVAVASAQTVTLRYLPPVGKAMRYTVVNKMTQSMPGMAPMPMSQTIPMTMTALSRKGNETTVQTKTGKMTVTVPAGSPMAGAKDAMSKRGSNQTSSVVVDIYGKPKTITTGAAAQAQMGGIQGVAFPVKPVKVGESWTVNLDLGKMAGAMSGAKVTGKIPMRYTLVKVQKTGGKSIATIAVSINGTANINAMNTPVVLKMKGNGTLTLDSSTGVVSKSHLTIDNDTSFGPGRSMKQRVDVTMSGA